MNCRRVTLSFYLLNRKLKLQELLFIPLKKKKDVLFSSQKASYWLIKAKTSGKYMQSFTNFVFPLTGVNQFNMLFSWDDILGILPNMWNWKLQPESNFFFPFFFSNTIIQLYINSFYQNYFWQLFLTTFSVKIASRRHRKVDHSSLMLVHSEMPLKVILVIYIYLFNIYK